MVEGKSWEELIADGIVYVENGVVYTICDMYTWENASSDALAGDLMLPIDGSITQLGNLIWDDSIYNEEWDQYGDYVGNAAFGYCINLTGIIIPDSVTSIGSGAFSGCTGLTSLDIPDSVTSMNIYALEGCTSLTSLDIPDCVTGSIDYAMFRDFTSLTSVKIGIGVTSIDNCAFEGCTSLTSVEIGDSVTSIGENVFNGCENLTTIKIGDDVTSIDDFAFIYCKKFKDVYYEGSLEQWCEINFKNSASNPCFYGANLYINGELITDITMLNTITEIKDNTFYGCANFININIPDSVTSIGTTAFSGCKNLTSVVISDSVKTIGTSAFSVCDNLKTITIQSTTPPSCGSEIFYKSSKVTAIYVPAESVNAYKTASGWSTYAAKIQAIP